MAKKTVSFRIDEELLQKLCTVADDECRTVGGQLTALARKCVEQYENRQLAAAQRAQKYKPADNAGLESI